MRLSKLLSAAAVAAIISLAVLAPKTSEAGTAANATIRNEVTVKYQNAAGTQMADKTATVDITILLKPATPTLALVGGNTATIALDGSTDYTYNITTNANGPDNYTLSTAVTDMADVDVTPSTVEFRTAIGGGGSVVTTVDLGATTAAAAAAIPATTQTTVTVLRDGGADALNLNKIAVGNKVVFGASATVCTVDVVNAATGYGTTTIEVTCPAIVNVALGDQIREVQTVYLHVDPAAILPGATVNQTIAVDASAQDTATLAAATAASTTTTTVLVSQMTVTKFVRNVTAGADGVAGNAGCGGTTLTINTGGGAGNVQYCTSGIKGKPTNTLEYIIAVATSVVGGSAQDVKISDPLNSFITYSPGTMRLDPGTGVFGALDDGLNTPDAGEFDTTNKIVYIYAGTGGTDSAALPFNTGAGGTLAVNTTSYGVYRVTIN